MKNINNKGFTLVELLIGLFILGIIAGPLLTTFYTSMAASVSAGRVGDATVAAESVIERLQVTDFNTIELNGIGFSGTFESDTTSTINDDDFVSGYNKFDVDVTFNPDAGRSGIATNPGGFAEKLNERELSQYLPMSNLFVQVPDSLQDPDTISYEDFLLDTDDIRFKSDMDPDAQPYTVATRTIDLEVVEINGNAHATIKYRYQYRYWTELGTIAEYVWDKGEETTYPITPTEGATVSSGSPLPIYIVFYPWEKGTTNVNVINLNNFDLSVVLAAQVPADEDHDGNPEQNDIISLSEDGGTYVNFHYSYDAELTDPDVFAEKFKVMTNLDVQYRTVIGMTDTGSGDNIDGLVERKEEDKAYEVTIDIYEINADGSRGDNIYTQTSTIVK